MSNKRSAEHAHTPSSNAMTSDIITQKMSHSFGEQFSIASVSNSLWIKSTLWRSIGVLKITCCMCILSQLTVLFRGVTRSVHPGQLGAILNIECSVYTEKASEAHTYI